jgi:hypothetical protein
MNSRRYTVISFYVSGVFKMRVTYVLVNLTEICRDVIECWFKCGLKSSHLNILKPQTYFYKN